MKEYVLQKEAFEKLLAVLAPLIDRRIFKNLLENQGIPIPREIRRIVVSPLNRLTFRDDELIENGIYLSEIQTCLDDGSFDKDPLIAVYLSLLCFYAAQLNESESDQSVHHLARMLLLTRATDLEPALVANCFEERP